MTTRHIVRATLLGAALLGALPSAARAQRGQDAALVGTVTDSSGAVLPNVTLSVTSPQLIGGPREAATDRGGAYRFPALPPGTYDVIAVRDGFKTLKRREVALPPGLAITLDFQMEVASVTEIVEIAAGSPAVDVHSSSSQVIISRPLLDNLPLSRTVTGYVNLAPGVVKNTAFGGSASANPFTLDGTNGNEPGWGTPTVQPNAAWIDEIQVVSLGANAQYGEYTGALANAITRSGSNRFSGLFDYWTTRPNWTGNNRGNLTPVLASRFRPIQILSRRDTSAQVGGPLRKDALWFFSGLEYYKDVNRPAAFANVPRTPDEPQRSVIEPKFIAKLTAGASPAVRLDGYYTHADFRGRGLNASPLVRPEALILSDRSETMWNARLTWTLDDRTLIEAWHGGHRADASWGPPADRRSGPPGHFDYATGVQSVNATYYSQYNTAPTTTGAGATRYVDRFLGKSHEFKVGVEYERARLLDERGHPGGIAYYDYNGQPYEAEITEGQTYRPRHTRTSAYFQDTWVVNDRLTINPGVRLGVYRGSVPGLPDLYSNSSISPRLGVAWDVSAAHRTVVRAHYGRYHDPMVTSYYDFFDPESQRPSVYVEVLGPGVFSELTRWGGPAPYAVDPDIKHSFAEEYLAGVEHDLASRLVLKLQYIRRDFKDSIGFVDEGLVWTPVSRRDPGPDGRLGTADDGGQMTVFFDTTPAGAPRPTLTNPAGAFRRYDALQIIGVGRQRNGWELQASYTWSRTRGSFNNEFSSNAANNDLSTNGDFVNPNRALFATGRTTRDFTHEAKVLGTYRLPFWGGVNVSGIYRYQSGAPWARSAGFGFQTQLCCIRVEPIGTRQLPATNSADLRIEKTFSIRRTPGRVGIYADVFNIANQGVANSVIHFSGPRFGEPQGWAEPRTLRIGTRVVW